VGFDCEAAIDWNLTQRREERKGIAKKKIKNRDFQDCRVAILISSQTAAWNIQAGLFFWMTAILLNFAVFATLR